MIKRGGIYVIRYRHGPEFYVGATNDFKHRRFHHWHDIRSGKGECRGLAAFARIVGSDPEQFSLTPLLVCAIGDLRFYEDRFLSRYVGTPGCLNLMSSGNVHSEKTRAIMSARRKGRPGNNRGKRASDETRRKMSLARKGKRKTPEHRAAIRAAHLGKKFTPEHCAAMSAARIGKMTGRDNPFYGKTHTEESRAAMLNGSREYWARDGAIDRCREARWGIKP